MMDIYDKYKEVIQALKYEVYVDGQCKAVVRFNHSCAQWFFSVGDGYPATFQTLGEAVNIMEQWLSDYCKANSLIRPLAYKLGTAIDESMIVTSLVRAGNTWLYKGWKLGSQFIEV